MYNYVQRPGQIASTENNTKKAQCFSMLTEHNTKNKFFKTQVDTEEISTDMIWHKNLKLYRMASWTNTQHPWTYQSIQKEPSSHQQQESEHPFSLTKWTHESPRISPWIKAFPLMWPMFQILKIQPVSPDEDNALSDSIPLPPLSDPTPAPPSFPSQLPIVDASSSCSSSSFSSDNDHSNSALKESHNPK